MKIIEENNFRYIENNPGKEVLLLLHGLFGELSNFKGIIDGFKDYNVVVPILPIMTMPLKQLGLPGLVDHVEQFIKHKGFTNINLLGNSLGGHIAQLYTLRSPEKIKSITLTGSSGLFENAMGSSFPKRGNYEFIKAKVESTFYEPEIATKELVDEVFEIVNNRSKAIRVVVTAKSAVRNNLAEKIHNIFSPTLLVWGKDDNITPPFVGEKFNQLIPNSVLEFIDKCGHAPMMEKPQLFNKVLKKFLSAIPNTLVAS